MFYSSVSDKSLFQTQKFYQIDIDILKQMGYNVILSNSIWDAFKFWKYKVVFAYFFRYSFLFALIAKIFGRDTYITGGIDALDKEYVGEKAYKEQRILFRLCYAVAKKCIIVSKTDLLHVEEIVKDNRKKIVYSEHTINTDVYAFTDYERKDRDFCTIGWMGSEENVKRKGIDKAILLFSKLKKYPEFIESKFFILGRKGVGTPMLESLIEKLDLQKDVIITGEVTEEEKVNKLKSVKYYFQLSHYEGFGVAALEALVAGDVLIHSGKGGLGNPIYANHVLVDLNKDINAQACEVYKKLMSIDVNDLSRNANECCTFYDNKRRLEDFKSIMGSALCHC